jgi:hypothetical protein
MLSEYSDAKRDGIFISSGPKITKRVLFDRKAAASAFEKYLALRKTINSDKVAEVVSSSLKDEGGLCSEHFIAEVSFEYLQNNLQSEFSKRRSVNGSFTVHEIWTIICDTVGFFDPVRGFESSYDQKYRPWQYQTELLDGLSLDSLPRFALQRTASEVAG